MSYKMIDYNYDEPAFTGTVNAAFCDTHRDIASAFDDYAENGSPHYLILSRDLADEFDGWVTGLRTLLWKQQLNRFTNIIASATIVGIPMALIRTKLHIDTLDAKITERRGFYIAYIANNYKYKDGCIGVNLAKFSRAGERLQAGKAPL